MHMGTTESPMACHRGPDSAAGGATRGPVLGVQVMVANGMVQFVFGIGQRTGVSRGCVDIQRESRRCALVPAVCSGVHGASPITYRTQYGCAGLDVCEDI